jgi:hypothetical protein
MWIDPEHDAIDKIGLPSLCVILDTADSIVIPVTQEIKRKIIGKVAEQTAH